MILTSSEVCDLWCVAFDKSSITQGWTVWGCILSNEEIGTLRSDGLLLALDIRGIGVAEGMSAKPGFFALETISTIEGDTWLAAFETVLLWMSSFFDGMNGNKLCLFFLQPMNGSNLIDSEI